jgi:hypothetical protein
MNSAICRDCGAVFEPRQPYHDRCLDCARLRGYERRGIDAHRVRCVRCSAWTVAPVTVGQPICESCRYGR